MCKIAMSEFKQLKQMSQSLTLLALFSQALDCFWKASDPSKNDCYVWKFFSKVNWPIVSISDILRYCHHQVKKRMQDENFNPDLKWFR